MPISMERLADITESQMELKKKTDTIKNLLIVGVTIGGVVLGVDLLLKGLKGKEIKK